jgi:RNA polymerase sigma-70 factor, ECF subfamily
MDVDHDDEFGSLSVYEVAELAKLFQEHRSRLLTMLQRRLDPLLAVRIDAEDVLSEAFVVARRKWSGFATSGMTPYSWLYGIARDCLIDAWRRENRQLRALDKEMPWPDRSSAQLAMGLMGSLTSPSEAVVRGELNERVRQVLDGLRPKDREILWMRHFDELSFRETALILGTSEDAAMQRYSRALRRVTNLWRELFDSGGTGP